MELLIDYLEKQSSILKTLRERLKKLEKDFLHISDPDIRHEIAAVRKEIAHQNSEIKDHLLIHLEEIHHIQKYFPEFLEVMVEDQYVGPLVKSKMWLLEYKPLAPQEAMSKMKELHLYRTMLKDARRYVRGTYGRPDYKTLITKYPLVRGYVNEKMGKDDLFKGVDEADAFVLKQGWLILLNDSLIEMAINKFLGKVKKYVYEENRAKAALKRAAGRGSTMEYNALRELQAAQRKKEKYAHFIRQIMLSNPDYLRNLKRKTNWLSREKKTVLQKLAEGIAPASVKEQIWLKEMHERLGGE